MIYASVPGVVETRESFDETTLVVDPARLVEACTALRDEHGFNFLADIAVTDYLGWGEQEVAGYIGTAGGRDLHVPGSQGLARVPDPKPKRFSVSYHLLRVSDDPVRLRVQVWLDDGEAIDSLLPVWPAADWFERAHATAFSTVVRRSASSIAFTSDSKTLGPLSGQSTRSELRPALASGRSLTTGRSRFSAS